MKAVSVNGLVKNYSRLRAVNDISFDIERGEIFGVVGPNGAGKTTTIECIEGLRAPDQGSITVLGHDVLREQKALQEHIGVQLQATSLYDHITVHESLGLFASLYQKRIDWGRNWDRLVGPLGLADKTSAYYQSLSGGQKQRLHIALALVHDPEIIFLDELTTGLDPQARRSMWELLLTIRDQGKTIFLTTHYMEEAEYLCDRVAIFDQGKIIALDSPSGLIARLGGDSRIVLSVAQKISQAEFADLPSLSRVEQADGQFVLYSSQSSRLLLELVRRAESLDWTIEDLHVQRADLEDVFLSLTGREIRS